MLSLANPFGRGAAHLNMHCLCSTRDKPQLKFEKFYCRSTTLYLVKAVEQKLHELFSIVLQEARKSVLLHSK